MKKCPFCAAEMENEVIKCKHCGEFVSEKVRHAHLTGFWQDLGQKAKKQLAKFEDNAPARKAQRKKENILSNLGCLGFIVLIIVIAILVCFSF